MSTADGLSRGAGRTTDVLTGMLEGQALGKPVAGPVPRERQLSRSGADLGGTVEHLPWIPTQPVRRTLRRLRRRPLVRAITLLLATEFRRYGRSVS